VKYEDFEVRGTVGSLERLRTLDLESYDEFSTSTRAWVNGELTRIVRKRADEICRANGIDPQRIRITPPETLPDIAADLLLANILAGPLVELAPRFAALVEPGGQILLSGILKTQLEDIQLAYRPAFDLAAAEVREDWACICGTRT